MLGLLRQQWWRLKTNKSLWADFVTHKYYHGIHPNRCSWKKGQSTWWKQMRENRNMNEKEIKWILGNEEVNFFI